MATLNPPKSISKRKGLRQDTAVTAFVKAQEFFYNNRTLVYGIIAVVIVLLLAAAGYAYMQSQNAERAQELLGGIVMVYENGDYRAALDGTEDAMGLLAIAEDYGNTEAGNLAMFYAADALFRLGEYDQALEYFQDTSKDNHVVGASALAGEAAIYEIQESFDRAGDLYREAAALADNALLSPDYLLSAGRAYEEAGAYADAQDAYQRIREDYPESTQAFSVDFYLARVAAKRK